MMLAAAHYAKPAEDMEWEKVEPSSEYIVSMPEVHTLIVHDLPYECKFFVTNAEFGENVMEDVNIVFHKEMKLTNEMQNDNQADSSRMQARNQVLAIANFKYDWDGYGAIRPISDCLSHALDIIDDENFALENLTDIYPNPNGTITFEWENGDNEIGLELGNQEFSYYVRFGEYHSYNNKKQYVAEEIVNLAKFVSFMR